MQNAVHIGNLTKENVNVLDSLVGILHYTWQLGEGGTARSQHLAQCFVPLLPNCLLVAGVGYKNVNFKK